MYLMLLFLVFSTISQMIYLSQHVKYTENGVDSWNKFIIDVPNRLLLQYNVLHMDIQPKATTFSDWSDWFEDTPDFSVSNSYSSSIFMSNNTHVNLCVFIYIESPIDMASGDNISLCVEECSFIDCFQTAICFRQGSHCVLSKVCASQYFVIDYANYSQDFYGRFCSVGVKSGSQNLNIADQLSVCQCADYGFSGNVSFNNVNTSQNQFDEFDSFSFSSSSLSLSTFFNNTGYYYVIGLFGSDSNYVSQCNIINNRIGYEGIIVHYDANSILSDCIIDLNYCQFVVVIWSGNVTLNCCYVQEGGWIVDNVWGGAHLTYYSPLADNQSLILYHFDSHNCNSMFIPTETIQQTPLETPVDSLRESPINTLFPSPQITPSQSPIQTPIITHKETPFRTPIQSPIQTPIITHIETPFRTPIQSPIQTPIITHKETPFRTPIQSPIQTPLNTHRETPMSSAGENQQNEENNNLDIILGSSAGGLATIIAVLATILKTCKKNFEANSNQDEEKEIENKSTKKENPPATNLPVTNPQQIPITIIMNNNDNSKKRHKKRYSHSSSKRHHSPRVSRKQNRKYRDNHYSNNSYSSDSYYESEENYDQYSEEIPISKSNQKRKDKKTNEDDVSQFQCRFMDDLPL